MRRAGVAYFIREVYVLEREVKVARATGGAEHARVRWEQSLPMMDKLYVWLTQQQPNHPPKSVMGNAISYTLKNWQALTRFITNTGIPPRQQPERACLRVVALGRKTICSRATKKPGKISPRSTPSSPPVSQTLSIPWPI